RAATRSAAPWSSTWSTTSSCRPRPGCASGCARRAPATPRAFRSNCRILPDSTPSATDADTGTLLRSTPTARERRRPKMPAGAGVGPLFAGACRGPEPARRRLAGQSVFADELRRNFHDARGPGLAIDHVEQGLQHLRHVLAEHEDVAVERAHHRVPVEA